jgi:vacuole morphology and inheritance protein 14
LSVADSFGACRKYLSDPTEDVRVATENILADFLREIRHVTAVRKRLEERAKAKRDGDIPEENEEAEESQTNTFSNESTANSVLESSSRDEHASELNVRDLGGKHVLAVIRALFNVD